ncbi:MAG TPA: MBL fold metallo-hydrolase, partial [Syntrophomonas sp.]|nr:MBL fold metallo-hydrolase [Syntrophomonas sp.]
MRSIMQVHILASGSTGNSVLLQLGGKNILIDAGISARRIEQGLAGVGVKAGELDGVLITHEHIDHIKGLDVFIRRHKIPVYTRPGTWEGIPCRSKLPPQCCCDIYENIDIGPVRIETFPISHDASDPVGFCFYWSKIKWTLATDLGVITPEVKQALAHASLAILESNHDMEMLQTGPYPSFLKQRIKGIKGHLSNLDAARLLAYAGQQGPMQVFLAHLSK